MNRLNLSILPSQRYDDISGMPVMEREGFVDDLVVLALVAGTTTSRQTAVPSDLVLAADDMDFAGWSLSPALPTRATEAPTRRPAPPVIAEPGIGEPHLGSHRWWLAGLAGAFSTMLFSVLLLSLSQQPAGKFDDFSVIRAPVNTDSVPTPELDNPPTPPELTEVAPIK